MNRTPAQERAYQRFANLPGVPPEMAEQMYDLTQKIVHDTRKSATVRARAPMVAAIQQQIQEGKYYAPSDEISGIILCQP